LNLLAFSQVPGPLPPFWKLDEYGFAPALVYSVLVSPLIEPGTLSPVILIRHNQTFFIHDPDRLRPPKDRAFLLFDGRRDSAGNTFISPPTGRASYPIGPGRVPKTFLPRAFVLFGCARGGLLVLLSALVFPLVSFVVEERFFFRCQPVRFHKPYFSVSGPPEVCASALELAIIIMVPPLGARFFCLPFSFFP